MEFRIRSNTFYYSRQHLNTMLRTHLSFATPNVLENRTYRHSYQNVFLNYRLPFTELQNTINRDISYFATTPRICRVLLECPRILGNRRTYISETGDKPSSLGVFEYLKKRAEESNSRLNFRLPSMGVKLEYERKDGRIHPHHTTTNSSSNIPTDEISHESRRITKWWFDQYGDGIPSTSKKKHVTQVKCTTKNINNAEDRENEQSEKAEWYNCLDESSHEYSSTSIGNDVSKNHKKDGATNDSASYYRHDLEDLQTINVLTNDHKSDQIMESLTEEDLECLPPYEKPFKDLIEFRVKGGDGGWSRTGSGPGYGGHGGDIVLEARNTIESFIHLDKMIYPNGQIKAENGEDAWEAHRGLHGKTRIIPVPLGTIVRRRFKVSHSSNGERDKYQFPFWHQFLVADEQLLVAQGGKGGVAPSFFKAKDGHIPEQGEEKRLQLELRLMTDVALIGLPNSGKTSLASSVTRYYGRIGPEPCSTLRPHLALLRCKDGVNIQICDLPALFQNSRFDSDKGRKTLRHLYRARVLVYVIDMANPSNGVTNDLIEQFEMLRREAHGFNKAHPFKREMVVGTKCDMLHRESLFNLDSLHFRLKARYPNIPVVGISARFGLGLDRMVTKIRELVFPDMLEQTHRVVLQPLKDILLPTEGDIGDVLKRLDLDALPPVLLPSSDAQSRCRDPPVTQIHPSYKQTSLPHTPEIQLSVGH